MSYTQIVDATPNQTGKNPANGLSNRGRLASAQPFKKKDNFELLRTPPQKPFRDEAYFKKLNEISKEFADRYGANKGIENTIIRALLWPTKPHISWLLKDQLRELAEDGWRKFKLLGLARVFAQGTVRKLISREKRKGKIIRCLTRIHASQRVFSKKSLAIEAAEISAKYAKERGKATELLQKFAIIAKKSGEFELFRTLEYIGNKELDANRIISYLDREIGKNKIKLV